MQVPDMPLLVIGNSGQLAQALRERSGLTGPDAVVIRGRPDVDITCADSLKSALQAARPSLVINASAYTAVDRAESDEETARALNETGPRMLAELTAERGIPLIHVSTDYVFDGAKPGPYTETDAVSPLGVYGRTKLAGEERVASANPDHVILRTAWVYSPFGANFVKTMLRLAGEHDHVRVVADQQGNPTNALDLADGILEIAHCWRAGHGKPGIFHMTASGEASWAEFASFIFASSRTLGGPFARVEAISSAEYPTPARRPANSRLDSTRLRQAYGVQLPGWQESVRACIERLISSEATAQ